MSILSTLRNASICGNLWPFSQWRIVAKLICDNRATSIRLRPLLRRSSLRASLSQPRKTRRGITLPDREVASRTMFVHETATHEGVPSVDIAVTYHHVVPEGWTKQAMNRGRTDSYRMPYGSGVGGAITSFGATGLQHRHQHDREQRGCGQRLTRRYRYADGWCGCGW